jgi:hypothetical protein
MLAMLGFGDPLPLARPWNCGKRLCGGRADFKNGGGGDSE